MKYQFTCLYFGCTSTRFNFCCFFLKGNLQPQLLRARLVGLFASFCNSFWFQKRQKLVGCNPFHSPFWNRLFLQSILSPLPQPPSPFEILCDLSSSASISLLTLCDLSSKPSVTFRRTPPSPCNPLWSSVTYLWNSVTFRRTPPSPCNPLWPIFETFCDLSKNASSPPNLRCARLLPLSPPNSLSTRFSGKVLSYIPCLYIWSLSHRNELWKKKKTLACSESSGTCYMLMSKIAHCLWWLVLLYAHFYSR